MAISRGGPFECQHKHDNSPVPWLHGDALEVANFTCHHEDIQLGEIEFFKIFGNETFINS